MIPHLTGSAAQWATFVVIIIGGITAWFKYAPERRRAANEGDQIKINEAELIRTDYAKQIADFRREVHGYKNEVAKVTAALSLSESARRRRDDRIAQMMFVLRLLMSEVRRLDPKSVILDQAEAMLEQMAAEDARHAPRDAMSQAQDTVKAAQATVEELKHEGDGK